MAGLGIEPDDLEAFEIGDPDERSDELDAVIQPKLDQLAKGLVDGLSRVAGHDLYVHSGKIIPKKGQAPEEIFIAFCQNPKGYRNVPYLAVSVSREHVHARVVARTEADKKGAMKQALIRESANLAKKGKPFRKLRAYMGWAYEELPEIAPAHSAAFWEELAGELGGRHGGIDVGIAWSSQEARGLGLGDVLGAFRDLSPLYKLLIHAE
jgi:uncharacterized protein YktB (UPF0637 family)